MIDQWLASWTFTYFLVFCRLGAAIMLFPGIGESFVPARLRLVLALAISALLAPLLISVMPPEPRNVGDLLAAVGGEILIGLFIGMVTRILISAVNTAGTVIATQSGLASAMMFDIAQTTQATVVTNLLSVAAVTLLFITDLHHVLLSGLRASYDVFPPGHFLPATDAADYMAKLVSHAFSIGVRIAAPQIVVGLMVYLGAGVMARLMPAMQIFFVLMAPQIMLSFLVLMMTISASLLWYLHYMEDIYRAFPTLP